MVIPILVSSAPGRALKAHPMCNVTLSVHYDDVTTGKWVLVKKLLSCSRIETRLAHTMMDLNWMDPMMVIDLVIGELNRNQ